LIYLNRAPIIWYSKTQKTVETSTFRSEFVALRIATEQIKALRYNLRMMGVPIENSANVLVDNETVVKNSTIPSSTLQRSIIQFVAMTFVKLFPQYYGAFVLHPQKSHLHRHGPTRRART